VQSARVSPLTCGPHTSCFEQVPCPPGTAGDDVPSGCTAVPHAHGTVTATTVYPFFAVDGVNGGSVELDAGYSLVTGVVTGTSVESVLRVLRSCFTRFPPLGSRQPHSARFTLLAIVFPLLAVVRPSNTRPATFNLRLNTHTIRSTE